MSEDMPEDIKTVILGTVRDLAGSFMYYDRREDDELPRGAIEKAIADGHITMDEIVNQFRSEIGGKKS